MAKRTLTPDDLLAEYPPPIADLCNQLRRVVGSLQPELEERAYAGWRAIGLRHPIAGYVGGLFLAEDGVKLLFEHGHLLPDPQGVLEGTTKQTRHITFGPGDALPEGTIAALVQAAIDIGLDIKAVHRA